MPASRSSNAACPGRTCWRPTKSSARAISAKSFRCTGSTTATIHTGRSRSSRTTCTGRSPTAPRTHPWPPPDFFANGLPAVRSHRSTKGNDSKMTSMIETGAQGVAGAGAGAPTSQLSFAQERLWFIDKLADDKALYNASMRFALEGGLDREALERALREVVRRHEVLRTGFAAEDGAPMVVPESSFELAFRDMRDDPAPGRSMRRDQDAIASRP